MSYRDIKILLSKASAAITVLGIKRTEVSSVTVSNLSCLVPRIELEVDCFIRLCRLLSIRPSVERTDDWLKGEFRYREFAFVTHVWCKDDACKWEALNSSSQAVLEVKRPAIGVKRAAIEDKRRSIGLPAPKVIDF